MKKGRTWGTQRWEGRGRASQARRTQAERPGDWGACGKQLPKRGRREECGRRAKGLRTGSPKASPRAPGPGHSGHRPTLPAGGSHQERLALGGQNSRAGGPLRQPASRWPLGPTGRAGYPRHRAPAAGAEAPPGCLLSAASGLSFHLANTPFPTTNRTEGTEVQQMFWLLRYCVAVHIVKPSIKCLLGT